MDRRGRVLLVVLVLLASPALAGCLDLLTGSGIRSDWAYQMTGIDALLGEGLDGDGVKVAVVDTGIERSHPDIQPATLAGWRDFVDGRSQPYDDNGHGTHVAGLIVAHPEQSDLRGGAPGARLLVAKAISEDGSGTDQDVASAIDWATNRGADVISLSLGAQPGAINLGSATQDAAQRAVDRGVYVVAAAGNEGEGSNDVASPGNVRGVIAVGAVDRDRNVASFSNRGSKCSQPAACPVYPDRQHPNKKPEVVAPGVDLTSTWDGSPCGGSAGQDYCSVRGTSQAVPFVSSAAALALQDKPAWQRENSRGGSASAVQHVKGALRDAAVPVPGQSTPHDDRAGYGLVKAVAWRDRI